MNDSSHVETLFFAALEKGTEEEQTEFLNSACDDANVRREVVRLLNAHPRMGDFLQRPAAQIHPAAVQLESTRILDPSTDGAGGDACAETEGGMGDDPVSLDFLERSPHPESLGRIGHYEVLQVLGKGGFGIVFRAYDEKLQRVVAVKVLGPRLATTSPPRKRFLREARSSAKVRHENIVQVYAVEEQPLPYLVMEFIPGETLQQRLDRIGPLEVDEVVKIGRQIAAGLAAAHAQGLIHRDIKPSNILIEASPNECVKITDFGLARAADDASVTQSGIIAGTPMYMAPEQVLDEKLDHRADLFSLGSVLYTMCSGRPPFRASNTLAVLKRVAEDTPRPITDIIPEVPTWLCDLISCLHAKKPEDRIATAQDVADLLAQGPTSSRDTIRFEIPHTSEMSPVFGNSAGAVPERLSDDSAAQSQHVAVEQGDYRSIKKRSSSRIARWTLTVAGLLLLLGIGFTEASGVTNMRGAIIQLFSPEGTLVVEVDDPAVSVKIDGSELVITGAGAREIRLKPGKYTVEATKSGKVVTQELITVTRNGRQVVRVSQLPATAETNAAPAANVVRKTTEATDWERSVAALPAAAQFDEVQKAFRTRNPEFNGRIDHELRDNLIHSISIDGTGFRDLSPVRAIPGLHGLSVHSPELTDLSPLQGMKLNDLGVMNTKVSDLSPLRGMELVRVDFSGTRSISDLTPLEGMPLKGLTIYATQVVDLSPLKGMPLLYLNCDSTKVTDLTPLSGSTITNLNLTHTLVSDLSPLKGLKLIDVYMPHSQVTDFSPLLTVPLKSIVVDFQPLRDPTTLRAMKTLEKINQKPVEQFWSEYFSEWKNTVAKLPAEDQVKAFGSRLIELNPGFDGTVDATIESGVVTGLKFETLLVSDISPIAVFTRLSSIDCCSTNNNIGRQGLLIDLSPLKGLPLTKLRIISSPITDLSPLKGIPLKEINVERTQVTDLSPLRGMPLTHLNVYSTPVTDLSPLEGLPLVSLQATGTQISDLSPLKGMPLISLQCVGSRVSDLSPLKDCPLQHLLCDLTRVSDVSPLEGKKLVTIGLSFTVVADLSPLEGMPIQNINFASTKVTDVSPLKDLPLKIVSCTFMPDRDESILRAIPTLQTINDKPVAEFWKELDAKPQD